MSGRRKIRKNLVNEAEEDPEFQIAPMADVLFVLLVFFISITSTEVLKKVKDLELPEAQAAAEKKKRPHQVLVNITFLAINSQSKIIVDDKTYRDPMDLVPMLQQRVAADPQVRVLIRADKNVEYSFISDVMRACSTAQIPNVTFSVLQGGAQAPAAPAGGGA